MAASRIAVVARTPNAPEVLRPPARTGAFLQTLRTLPGRNPRSPQEPPGVVPEKSRAPEGRNIPQDGTAEPLGNRAEPDRESQRLEPSSAERQASSEPPWDPLDPFSRALASLVLVERVQPASTAHQRTDLVRSASLEHLFGALVKRVAWSTSPDRSSATLRLEIGAGELAGTTVLITASPQELCVVLDTPPGVDLEVWKNRLSQRLASKGLAAIFP